MNNAVGDAYADELAKLFQQQGPLLYDGQHSLCLTTPCLHHLQKRFSAIQVTSTDPVPYKFAVLQQLQGCLAKVDSLKLISDKQIPLPSTATLNLEPFRALHTLVIKKVSLSSVTGLQRLRSQLRVLVVQRCRVDNIDDLIVRCGGDDSTSFVWSSLRELDMSNNQITKLGDSLQYLPYIEKVNFSNNSIGYENKETVPEGQSSSSVGLVNGSESFIIGSSEGITCMERVTFLHLGFNKLCEVPRFASKAKYTLHVLNLRNNELGSIEGLHELDSLIELDLTDNLLINHNTLSPLKNLHNLAVLTLQGNPLAFHSKHRLKTAQNLSNLIDKNAFRLDGKKLSTAEKKEIPNLLTHYPGSPSLVMPSSTPLPVSTPSQSVVGVGGVEYEGGGATPAERFSKAIMSDAQEGVVVKKPRKKKRSSSVKIIDSDENQPANDARHGDQEELTVGSIPLMNEQHLDRIEQVRKQLEHDWIKTMNPTESSSTDTSTSHSLPVATKTTPKKKEGLEGSGGSTGRSRERKSRTKRRKREGVRGVEGEAVSAAECEGEFGPKTSSPDRGPTPSNVEGECFVVERYESDVEDDDSLSSNGRGHTSGRSLLSGGRGRSSQGKIRDNRMLIVITERFLEEQSSRGKRIDRWDLNSLQEASIDKRPWKKGKAGMSDVLFVKFNLDRRDRRRREYVLMEEGVNDSLLGMLDPIVEQNRATLSLENRLECLHCQRVFDKSQAVDEPSSEATPLPLGSHKNRSLSKLMCPYCSSQLLQIASFSSKPFKPSLSSTSSLSPHHTQQATPLDTSNRIVVTPGNQRKAGFDITPPYQKSSESNPKNSEINTDILEELEAHSPTNSIDFHSESPTSLTGFQEPTGNEPASDLSPWKPQEKKTIQSRPRAGAICESNDEQPAKLQESFEDHDKLHEARKSSTEVPRKSTNPFDDLPDNPTSCDSTKRDRYVDDVVSNLPELEASTSVPSSSQFHSYMSGKANSLLQSAKPPEASGHNRSKSVDCHPRKALNATPPMARKKYTDPYPSRDESTNHSLSSVKEGELVEDHHASNDPSHNSSRKSSLMSLDERGSSHSSRHDGEHSSQSSGESGRKSKRNSYDKQSSSDAKQELYEKFFSSGDLRKGSCDRGYSSGEASQRLSVSRGYTSSEGARQKLTTGGRVHRVHSHDDIKSTPQRSSNFKSRGGGSSSEERRAMSLTLYKDEDPTYIDNSLSLYLDMEVFDLDKKEEFRLLFRTSVVQYGHSKEMPALVVVSNLSMYIFRVTAPENSDPLKWLELMSNHLLRRLTYIDIGVGYQFLRVEFRVEHACYTFLLRDEEKCTLLSSKLAFIVSDVAKSSFRTVGVCPFSMENLRYPKRKLKEVLLVDYDELSGRTTPTKGRSTPTRGRSTPTRGLSSSGDSRPWSSLSRSRDDDELVLYRMVHKRVSARSQATGPSPVTIVVTKTTIFLAKENFTHWPLPRIQALPPRDSLKPPYSDVQQRSITDIDQIVLDRDQVTQVTIRFFKECVLEGEDRYWSLVMHKAGCVEKLVSSIKTLWKEAFQTDLSIIYK